MPIVSQFASFSHSLFPPWPLLSAPKPLLMLPAPRQEQKKQTPITISYTHALLSDLSEADRERLIHAMTTLLDISVGHMLNLLNMDAFRAAQVAFSREITGQNPPRPHTPDSYKAEQSAALVDFMINTPRAVAAAREQAGREFDALLKAMRERDHE